MKNENGKRRASKERQTNDNGPSDRFSTTDALLGAALKQVVIEPGKLRVMQDRLRQIRQGGVSPMPDKSARHTTKDRVSKVRLDLVPQDVVEALARVITFGAEFKYSPRDWEKGECGTWMEYMAAAERHIIAWKTGENYDRQSGELHLSHALCDLAYVLAWQLREIGTDDRPKIRRSRVWNNKPGSDMSKIVSILPDTFDPTCPNATKGL